MKYYHIAEDDMGHDCYVVKSEQGKLFEVWTCPMDKNHQSVREIDDSIFADLTFEDVIALVSKYEATHEENRTKQ